MGTIGDGFDKAYVRLQPVFDPEGDFIALKTGDATLSKWAKDKLDANPEMYQERERAYGLEREKDFWGPTGVAVDDQNRIFVVESARNRVQVYLESDTELALTFAKPLPNVFDLFETLPIFRRDLFLELINDDLRDKAVALFEAARREGGDDEATYAAFERTAAELERRIPYLLERIRHQEVS